MEKSNGVAHSGRENSICCSLWDKVQIIDWENYWGVSKQLEELAYIDLLTKFASQVSMKFNTM